MNAVQSEETRSELPEGLPCGEESSWEVQSEDEFSESGEEYFDEEFRDKVLRKWPK